MSNIIKLHKNVTKKMVTITYNKKDKMRLEEIEEFRDNLIELNIERKQMNLDGVPFDDRWSDDLSNNKDRNLLLQHLCRIMIDRKTSRANRIRCAEIVHNLNPYRCAILALVKELQDKEQLHMNDDNWLAKNFLYKTANQYYYGVKHKIDDIFGIK